jgi:heptosyltransferase-3
MPRDPKRILIYRIGNLGDTVIALPSFQAVRRRFPKAHITLLTARNPRTGHVVANDVLPPDTFDECITYRQSGGATDPRELLKLLPALWRRRFDLLVYLPPRLRTEFSVWRDLLFFRIAGIPWIIGHNGRRPVPRRRAGEPLRIMEHEADYILDRLAAGGIPVPPTEERRIDLGLSPAEISFARDYLLRRGVPLDGFPVAICPGTKYASKKWPEDRFAELGARLMAAHGAFPVVVGGPEDAELAQRLIAGWGAGVNSAGDLTVRQSAAVLGFCRLFVGNDSGPGHLAAAVGTPCVGIYASIDFPGRWDPYGNRHVTLRHDLDCSACFLTTCVARKMECIKSITVEEAMDACRRVIQQHCMAEPKP